MCLFVCLNTRCAPAFSLFMPGCCIRSFSETDLAFCEKVKTDKREFPSAVERSLEDNTTPLLTNKHIKQSSVQLCGAAQPILGYSCRNGVSCTSEILILKAPLWLDLLTVSLLDSVPICSVHGAVCVDPTSEYSKDVWYSQTFTGHSFTNPTAEKFAKGLFLDTIHSD